MLTETDFNCPVRHEKINGTLCWRYAGNDLRECVVFARKVRTAGEKFWDPLTGDIRSAHRQRLTEGMSLLLAAMQHYHDYNDMRTMTYPNEFPMVNSKAARGFTTHYNYLIHYGLLGKESRDGVVHYWVTDLGREYLDGKELPGSILNIGKEILGFDPTAEMVSMTTLFSASELDEMQKPLWFLPEDYRQEMLTAEEMSIA